MAKRFILSCESTVDLPYSYVSKREIPLLEYTYTMDGVEYVDDMGRDPEAMPRFYSKLAAGVVSKTSQISTFRYTEFFEALLEQGDVLHIAFGSGMTQSVFNAMAAAEELREKYPQRQLVVIDSLCSSSGYGLLVDSAADLRDEGRSLEEVEDWVNAHRQLVHHQFFSTDLTHFRRSGRMSGPAATLGAILNICPIMRLDDQGRIYAYDKVRGKKRAIQATLDAMEQHAIGGKAYSGKCFICHSYCPETAEQTRDAVMARFPNLREGVRVCEIGTIIAGHCGPGTVAVFFYGSPRAPQKP